MNNFVAKYSQRLPCGTGYHKDDKRSTNAKRMNQSNIRNDELEDIPDEDVNWLDFLSKDDINYRLFC